VFEYQDPASGQWEQRSVRVPAVIERLSAADRAKLAAAKLVIQTIAEADATAKGLLA
jgi:hypothetical protein